MDLAGWLRSLGLEQYEAAFRENAIDEAVLLSLTAEDLKDLGVGLVGHRRKLLDAIASLRGNGSAEAAAPQSLPTIDKSPEEAAERRQVTVMFSDLVGSTALSARMDPEDLREVISAYQKCVAEIVRSFGGFVAKYMGDGVLVYFGYPQAHEDDAERAVRAGLELIGAVAGLRMRAPLQTRVGIATGLVVVGDLIGSGEAQERGIVGETPNLAARLQGIAEPNTVVVAESTRRLLGILFELQDLGPRDLKGIAGPSPAWAVLRASSVASRFEALHATGLTALVGREEELDLLLRRWSKAKAREGQVVLVSGEAGIGKSRLTAALLERLAREPHKRMRYFCSPQRTDSALHPIIGQIERAAGLAHNDTPQARLDKLDALLKQTATSIEDAALLAEMLSLPNDGRYPTLELTPQQRRQRTLEALLSQMETMTRQSPVLMIFEDAHWTDPTSLELFGLVIERIQSLPALLIVTFRPEFNPPWLGRPHVTALTINRLTKRDVDEMIDRVIGNHLLSATIRQDIIERCDGIPLFTEEITKAVLEAEGEAAAERTLAAVPSPALAVPASLHASLMARLDRLGAAKEVAQIGATIGREFSYPLLASVARKTEAELGLALDRLIEAGLLFRQGVPPHASYLFKHALVQDAAYGTLIRSRRQQLHGRIVSALERQFPEITTAQPALLALHCTEAGLTENALDYWLKAGRQANSRFAMKEAVAHLSNGIALLTALPQGRARDEREIDFRLALAVSLIAMHGYGSAQVEGCAARAKELSDGLGDHRTRFGVYRVVWNSSLLRRPVPQSVSLAHELMTLARSADNPARLAIAHRALGYSMHIAGAQAEADRLLADGIVIADGVPDAEFALFGEHPGMICRGYRSSARCLMGFLDDGARLADAAVQHARTRKNPFSLAWALMCACHCYLWRRDVSTTERLALEAIAVSREHGLTQWLAFAQQSLGPAICGRGELQAGIDLQEEAMRSLHETGSVLHTTRFRLHLAEGFLMLGDLKRARSHLDAGLKHAESHGETYLAPELYRVEALLLEAEGAADEMLQNVIKKGMALARSQGAHLLELRLALVITPRLIKKGKGVEARALLAPIYECFTEGLDSPDLKEAKALLGDQRT